MSIKYMPIVKTQTAELRGIENLGYELKDKITPLFELTRSRISKKRKHGDIYRRLDKLKDVFGNKEFCLDLTTDPKYSNYQIDELKTSDNGYRNWCDFLIKLKDTFLKVIPVVMLDFNDSQTEDEFNSKLKSQIMILIKNFGKIAYRFPINYPYYMEDIDFIKVVFQDADIDPNKKLINVLDVNFMPKGKTKDYRTQLKPIISNLNQINFSTNVLATSSYPKIPTEYGDDEEGYFPLDKINLYKNFASSMIYGDYATIHPVRSTQAGGNGWIPRIDVPTADDAIFYYRSRRKDKEKKYSHAYVRVAQKVINDDRYHETKKFVGNCWGIEQIELAANGDPQGLHPSFWVSVRMNIYLTLRTKLIFN